MIDDDIIHLPDDALPQLSDLRGDLRLLAEILGGILAALLPAGMRGMAPALGVRLSLGVAQHIGGTLLRIATSGKWIRRWRDQRMRAEYDRGGITVVDLARKYHLGERQTYNILGAPDGGEPPSKQLKLW